MIEYDKLLNKEQCAAATAGDGPILVLAAAGTGKTRTLVHRVAYLAEQGISPRNQLLLTFTNRAAREMLERARALVGNDIGMIWSGTFHHVCNRFLRKYAMRLKFPFDFAILDRDDSHKLIESCIKEVTANKKDFPKKDVIGSWISLAANKCVPVEEICGDCLPDHVGVEQIMKVASLYEERKQTMLSMDFDDLLINGLKLLREHDDIREMYQEQFRHVLVDEYQDTNLLQSELVDLLAARHRNVMAVGDDFQCIYTWRGADVKNIMEFPKRWPGCQIIKLEQNYRSAPEILQIANESIKHNPMQFQKELRPTRKSRNKPALYRLRDGDDQARTILMLINRYLDDGYEPKDIAVLYRAHFHSIELQMALGRSSIPFVITSGLGVFEQAHTKDVIAFLRVCEHPRDFMAFQRFICLFAGVGEKSAESYWKKLGESFDITNNVQREQLRSFLRPAARGQWQDVEKIFEAYTTDNLATAGARLVERFLEAFYSDYLKRNYDNPENREDDIHELGLQLGKTGSVSKFLEDVALLTNVDHDYNRTAEGIENGNRIHLSTVHQAKGLEWPVVFIIWANEGMFPSSKSTEESGDDSEERRLFYVAVTRAKNELVLCAPSLRFSRDGGCFSVKLSRFLTELPKSCYTERFRY